MVSSKKSVRTPASGLAVAQNRSVSEIFGMTYPVVAWLLFPYPVGTPARAWMQQPATASDGKVSDKPMNQRIGVLQGVASNCMISLAKTLLTGWSLVRIRPGEPNDFKHLTHLGGGTTGCDCWWGLQLGQHAIHVVLRELRAAKTHCRPVLTSSLEELRLRPRNGCHGLEKENRVGLREIRRASRREISQAGRDALACARLAFWARFNFLVHPAGSRKYGGVSCNPSVMRSYFAPA